MLAGFVLGLQPLDFRLWIASSLLEILIRVVKFILIQVRLRFGDVDLVLQIVFLRFGDSRQLLREQGDSFLILFNCLFRFDLAKRDLLGFG
jgi:hypothetical protein